MLYSLLYNLSPNKFTTNQNSGGWALTVVVDRDLSRVTQHLRQQKTSCLTSA